MKPRELLGTGTTPDGEVISLAQEGGHFVVRVRGVSLMSSAVHGSEEQMATIACTPLAGAPSPRVLVGGLGMGFTLRAALDLLGPGAEVVVAELLPIIVDWNRGPLAELARRPLDDPRARVVVDDVAAILRQRPGAFDAILLDVDNGPDALTVETNAGLYGDRGVSMLRAALRPGGVLVVWSAFACPPFAARMRRAMSVEVVATRARGKKGSRHTLYVGRR